jgi:hypothetical protein
MAWREVSADPVAPATPREIVKAMISQPRTYDTLWREFVEARRRDDEELPADFEEFNLNNLKKLEME